MSSAQISCLLDATDHASGLVMEVWLDNQKLFDNVISKPTELVFDVDDDSGNHVLRFEMQNKTFDHTQISSTGDILADARLIIKNVAFDGIELGHLFNKLAVYTHDFNGTGNPVSELFYGEMGCNGAVTLQFETPIYLWLLENM